MKIFVVTDNKENFKKFNNIGLTTDMLTDGIDSSELNSVVVRLINQGCNFTVENLAPERLFIWVI